MTQPPKSNPTDNDKHAPGVSRTLEEKANESRRQFSKPDQEEHTDKEMTEERKRL